MPQTRASHCVAAGLVVAVGLVVTSAASPTASAVRPSSARPDFKIAYSHSSGPSWATGDVFIMNADGSDQRNLSRAPGLDDGPVWSPDGRILAFLSRRDGKQEIYVVNSDGGGLRNLTHSPEHDFAPAWSPDGRKIVFTRSRDYFKRGNVDLYAINANGTGQRRLTHTRGRHDGNPVWSYPASAVSGLRRLTRRPGHDSGPVWSPVLTG